MTTFQRSKSCRRPRTCRSRIATRVSELAHARKELATLYAALDHVDSGLLILDGKLRGRYSNPSLHRMFKSLTAEQIRTENPHYADMLRSAADAMSVNVKDYVAKRLAWVKSGVGKPMDLEMTNGTVLRCHLAVLPAGGRMLIYSDVTDIVRAAEEMERLATTDGMTGLLNRRHFLLLANREWKRARRYRQPLSLLMLDIDFFKSINDSFGHLAGDEVIVRLAEIAQVCKRDSDVVARIGGEEFALLLPATRLQQAQSVAERIRNEIACSLLEAEGRSIVATVSIGVASMSEACPDFPHLMSIADQALYQAKRAGRNRVICGSGEAHLSVPA